LHESDAHHPIMGVVIVYPDPPSRRPNWIYGAFADHYTS
jgi:hypothetical protein